MKQAKILGLVLMTMALTNCKAKVGEVEPSKEVATIEGIWATSCITDSSDSYIKSFQVQNGVMTIAYLRYGNTTVCDQSKLMATIMQSGPITQTGDSADISGGKNYEWQFNAITLTPNDAAATAMFNGGSFCGSNAWVEDQAAMIFGCNIPGIFDYTNVTFNTVHYGVFNIEVATTPDYLQFESRCAIAGYEEFCPSSNDRPTTLDGTVYYKQ